MGLPARAVRAGRLARQRSASTAVQPLDVVDQFIDTTMDVPDIMEFVASDGFLSRPNLYPRQGTLLKIIFLQDHLFTQYDHDTIGSWIETFEATGNEGIQPDVYERIATNSTCSCSHLRIDHSVKCRIIGCECEQYDGRLWFREIVSVIGRRGSKGHLGAICGAYVLWHYISRGDPHAYYGVDRDKRLSAIVFAGKKEQATANQWRDLFNVITGAPCFAPYISRPQSERLTLYAKTDFRRIATLAERGIETENDLASFEVIPAPSTTMAGRGPTSFMQFYDEMAHVVATGANRDAEEVYGAATPSLDQFKKDAFIYEGSSPWQMMGQFYENWLQSLEREDGKAVYPEKLMVQLPSWAPYEDWERSHLIPRRPPRRHLVAVQLPPLPGVEDVAAPVEIVEQVDAEGSLAEVSEDDYFRPMRGAIQEYDAEMQKLERANPETFAVERRSHWAAAINAYLNTAKVEAIFQGWPDPARPLQQQERGILIRNYKAHGDPSKSGANFGWAIAHTEVDPETGLLHAVFDVLHHWNPEDFPDHQIDYPQIEDELFDYVKRFQPSEVTFDQFNSASPIQRLRQNIRKWGSQKTITVEERTATRPMNWKRYETLKTAINMGWVHAPYYEQAELELRFLQEKNGVVDHPTSGPVQTKDVADCMAECVHYLLGEQFDQFIGGALSAVKPLGTQPGGIDPYAHMDPAHQALSGFTRGAGARRGLPPGLGRGRPGGTQPYAPRRRGR